VVVVWPATGLVSVMVMNDYFHDGDDDDFSVVVAVDGRWFCFGEKIE
jgi:hypothetical protein